MLNKEELELEIKKKFISTDVSYDREFNIVYVHDVNILGELKELQERYNFSISFGIFAQK